MAEPIETRTAEGVQPGREASPRRRGFAVRIAALTCAAALAACAAQPSPTAPVAPTSAPAPTATPPAQPTQQPKAMRLIAYFAANSGALKPQTLDHITDLIYFSIEPKPNGDLSLGGLDKLALDELAQMKRDHNLKLLLAVGGWLRSKGFAPMAQDDAARARFVANVVKFAADNGFDGIDYDWEHPKNAAEEQAYAALIADTKAAAQPLGLIVTAALAGWQNMPHAGFDALDRVHLMAYDQPGRHSTFDGAKSDVALMLSKGVPAGKIALGVPLYGRGIEDRLREMPYWLILANYAPKPNEDEASGMYFNNLDTARRKAEYAKAQGLAGLMVWELTQDGFGDQSLLKAMREVIK